MLWICIQFVIFPPNFMSTSYFVFGLIEALTGYMTWVFQKQEEFSVALSDYPGIGKDHTRLVVFFSRMGYVKKEAYKRADETGADEDEDADGRRLLCFRFQKFTQQAAPR